MRTIPCSEHLHSWALFVCMHRGYMGCRYWLQKGASSNENPIPPPSTSTEVQGPRNAAEGRQGHVNYIL